MHYHVSVTVRFRESLVSAEGPAVSGYTVAMGINAEYIQGAVNLACDDALCRHDADVERQVVHIEVTAITIDEWVPEVRQFIRDQDLDLPGIYYRSSLIFYENENE